MKNTGKIGKLILMILGVGLVMLSGRALLEIPGKTKILEEAVWLEEAVVLPENEGKLVIIHGEVEMTKPVYDEELGLTLNTVSAYRCDEEYRQTGFSSDERKWDWAPNGQKSLVGEAMIGEFELDDKILSVFPKEGYYEDFIPEEISRYGTDISNDTLVDDRTYVLVDAEMYYFETEYSTSDNHLIRENMRQHAAEREGDKVSYYRCFDASRFDGMTAAGVQQGNRLIAHEKLGAVVINGAATREEVVKSDAAYMIGGAGAFLVSGLILIFLGIRNGAKKETNKKRKKG